MCLKAVKLLLNQHRDPAHQTVRGDRFSGAQLLAMQSLALCGLQAKADMGCAHVHSCDDFTLFLHEGIPRFWPPESALP